MSETEQTKHALLSASGAERWMTCPGSIALCKGLPDRSSSYADEGTLAHKAASEILLTGFPCARYDEDMLEEVGKYVQQVRDYTGKGTLLVEQRVDYSDAIGVPDSFGTSDSIIISEDGTEIVIVDLKYGKGVQVDADNNPQLMLYALGALNEYGMSYDFKTVRLVISQPRINHLSEWTCTVDELMEFAQRAKESATIAFKYAEDKASAIDLLNPSEKGCRFCKAKSFCPALAKKVEDEIEVGFGEVDGEIPVSTRNDALADKMKAIPLIEAWCKAVRAAVEAELLQGKPVDGFKLVRGKQGNRKWSDTEAAEELLKSFRLRQEEMYDFSLISPTQAEKVLKDNPRWWPKVEELITRSEGKVSVAPVEDKRPALDVSDVEAGFEAINNEEGE